LKPSIPKGTRDFSPAEMQRRNYIFETIKSVFLLHGFQQIETPAMENLSVLEGKYGEEGDKLLFRILNSGPVLEQIRNSKSEIRNADVTEKGLRYDLTVPFARYVVQHRNEIIFPFKRFQIQPVWRADRPQRGRYREFYQCDADIIGSNSLLNEVELIQIIVEVFRQLKIEVKIWYNNRKILTGLAEIFGAKEKFMDLIIALDKYEKVGDSIYDELRDKGFSNETIAKFKSFIEDAIKVVSGKERHDITKSYFEESAIGLKGFNEIEQMSKMLADALAVYGENILDNIRHNLALARGLNYYTGAIIEVKASNVSIGSIAGGGRYDDLTGIFGLPNVSGVGISFGVDRIYDVMEELKLFDALKTEQTSTQILFLNFGEKEELFCLKLVTELRYAGIAAELYPDRDKIKKQMSYANDRKIPFVALVGEEEMKSGKIKLKNMQSGEENLVNHGQVAELLGK
jgi:histidyl-tRNA synthetase